MMFSVWKLITTVLINIHVCFPESKERNILLVHAISRHGDRTPVDTYPTDPFINETFAPFGWGQLTKVGKIHQYELGKFLRKKYYRFLGDSYSPDFVTIQTTDSDRTKMSAQLQMAALFPPKKDQIWNRNLLWQPVSLNYESLNEDRLLLNRLPCPRYYELKNEILQAQSRNNLSPFYDYLSQNTKMLVATPDDVLSLYSTLKAEEEFGLKLPSWTSKVYPNQMYHIAANSFSLNAYNHEMQRLKTGFLFKKILEDYFRKINYSNQKKMFVFVGHDSTIANFLIALGIWESQVPDYNALITLELLQMKKDFAVKIAFKNSTRSYNLKLPNCDIECPLQKFIDLTEHLIIKNFKKECFNTTWRLKVRESRSP